MEVINIIIFRIAINRISWSDMFWFFNFCMKVHMPTYNVTKVLLNCCHLAACSIIIITIIKGASTMERNVSAINNYYSFNSSFSWLLLGWTGQQQPGRRKADPHRAEKAYEKRHTCWRDMLVLWDHAHFVLTWVEYWRLCLFKSVCKIVSQPSQVSRGFLFWFYNLHSAMEDHANSGTRNSNEEEEHRTEDLANDTDMAWTREIINRVVRICLNEKPPAAPHSNFQQKDTGLSAATYHYWQSVGYTMADVDRSYGLTPRVPLSSECIVTLCRENVLDIKVKDKMVPVRVGLTVNQIEQIIFSQQVRYQGTKLTRGTETFNEPSKLVGRLLVSAS